MVIKLPRSRESTPVAVTPPSTTLGTCILFEYKISCKIRLRYIRIHQDTCILQDTRRIHQIRILITNPPKLDNNPAPRSLGMGVGDIHELHVHLSHAHSPIGSPRSLGSEAMATRSEYSVRLDSNCSTRSSLHYGTLLDS